MKKKICIVIGTRPEAIKMAPLILELKKYDSILNVVVCCTGQHKEMFDDAFNSFDLEADVFFDVMHDNQTLSTLTEKILNKLSSYFEKFLPDLVLVHGDTTTAMAAALSSFYKQILIGHVEAGLRTYNIESPFPEEFNRRSISLISNYHFAPTSISKQNLLNEGVLKEKIVITGNTVIDALFYIIKKFKNNDLLMNKFKKQLFKKLNFKITEQKYILITAHRRENIDSLEDICIAIKNLANKNQSIEFVFPVHLNPKIKNFVHNKLSNITNIKLTQPLDYCEFSLLMNFCEFIITDSGGIQEEAPSLGKPVLVIRDNSERPEAIEAGTAKLISSKSHKIFKEAQNLIDDNLFFNEFSNLKNPYGDGNASKRIVDHILKII